MHAPNLAHASLLHEQREAIKKQMASRFPKLSHGWAIAGEVDFAQKELRGSAPAWSKLPGWDERTPLSCRIFCLDPQGSHRGRLSDPIAQGIYVTLEKIISDLRRLGCNAVHFNHSIQDWEGNVTRQSCIALPHMRLSGSQDSPEYHRDIEGAGIFLAYLMDRGYATPQEVEAVFNSQFLEEAQRPEIQTKLRMLNGAGAAEPSVLVADPKKPARSL